MGLLRPKPNERALMCQEYYEVLIGPLRHVAYRCGYAIAVHGSIARDIDLVAIPWRVVQPISPEGLMDELFKAVKPIIGYAEWGDGEQPKKKPWGRLGWSIHLTPYGRDGAYLDISVVPIVLPPPAPE
jgi:hypothetical protein